MSESAVITEEIERMIGEDLVPPTEREVTREMIFRFANAIGDPNPLWNDEVIASKSRYGSIIAPPVFLDSLWPDGKNLKAVLDRLSELDSPLKRALNGGQEYEYFQPVRPGDVITVRSKLIDAKEREGKQGKLLVLTAEIGYTNQHGELVAKELIIAIRH